MAISLDVVGGPWDGMIIQEHFRLKEVYYLFDGKKCIHPVVPHEWGNGNTMRVARYFRDALRLVFDRMMSDEDVAEYWKKRQSSHA